MRATLADAFALQARAPSARSNLDVPSYDVSASLREERLTVFHPNVRLVYESIFVSGF